MRQPDAVLRRWKMNVGGEHDSQNNKSERKEEECRGLSFISLLFGTWCCSLCGGVSRVFHSICLLIRSKVIFFNSCPVSTWIITNHDVIVFHSSWWLLILGNISKYRSEIKKRNSRSTNRQASFKNVVHASNWSSSKSHVQTSTKWWWWWFLWKCMESA